MAHPTEANAPGARQVEGRRLSRRDAWIAAIILGLVIVGTQYDVIFQGRSLITSNFANPLDFRSLPQNYGPNMVPLDEWTRRHLSPYANIRDPGATWWQWEPSTQFLKQAIRNREWPFWDPDIAGGTPAMANLIPAFFFPPYLLVVLFGASVALLNAYFLLIVWSSALATFLFIRRHDIAFGPSLLGALAFMLSGTTQQHLGTFIGQAAACLPLALYGTRVFFDRSGDRSGDQPGDQPGRLRASGLAVAYGAISLASFPPVLAAVFGTAAVYALVAIVNELPAGKRAPVAAWWACAAALAFGLVAWYYVPALAARAASPQVSAAYGQAGLETISPGALYQLLSPTMMGGVQTYLPPLPHAPPSGPYLPYVGMVAIALAFMSRRSVGRGRTLWIACTATALVIVLKLLGAPGFQWMGHVPVVRRDTHRAILRPGPAFSRRVLGRAGIAGRPHGIDRGDSRVHHRPCSARHARKPLANRTGPRDLRLGKWRILDSRLAGAGDGVGADHRSARRLGTQKNQRRSPGARR